MTATVGLGMQERLANAARSIERQIGSVVLGKPRQVRIATAALICGEHLLLNDLPGVGKTTLGLALSGVMDGSFGRVQGTADLMPTDLTGVTVFDQSNGQWNYRSGPLMNNVVLVDELNRITPRTQSALLEAMAEACVTVDGETRSVPAPFMVVATMNPIGLSGTFPLTAGQLDRFGAALSLGSPGRVAERQILDGDGGLNRIEHIAPTVTVDEVAQIGEVVGQIHTNPALIDYALDICDHLRSECHLSTRAPASLLKMARAVAMLVGRSYVVPNDIKNLAVACLAHRIAGEGEAVDAHVEQVRDAIRSTPVPAVSA